MDSREIPVIERANDPVAEHDKCADDETLESQETRVEEKSVCLLSAYVWSEGPFRLPANEAAVVRNLPKHDPHLFNDSDMRFKGLCFGDGTAKAVTHPTACECTPNNQGAESTNERHKDCASLDNEALTLRERRRRSA